MAKQSASRGISIGMGVAALAGVALSVLTTTIDEWGFFDWLFNGIAAAFAIVMFVFAALGRSSLGALPADEHGLRRTRVLAIFALAAFSLVLLLFLGAGLTGAWDPQDGPVVGLIAAAAISLAGRLSLINRALESAN